MKQKDLYCGCKYPVDAYLLCMCVHVVVFVCVRGQDMLATRNTATFLNGGQDWTFYMLQALALWSLAYKNTHTCTHIVPFMPIKEHALSQSHNFNLL